MIKHDEDCPKQEAEFPCCEDQMCACDRDAFEILKAENSRYREALEEIHGDIYKLKELTDALLVENADLRTKAYETKQLYKNKSDQVIRFAQENARYREALKFYAQNPKRENGTEFSNSVEEFGKLIGDDLFCVTWKPMLDLGQCAREALKDNE